MKRRFNVYSDSISKDIVDELDNTNYNQFEDFEEICDLLNTLNNENKTFQDLIQKKYLELEEEYYTGVRIGAPTGATVSELALIEEIAEELDLELKLSHEVKEED